MNHVLLLRGSGGKGNVGIEGRQGHEEREGNSHEQGYYVLITYRGTFMLRVTRSSAGACCLPFRQHTKQHANPPPHPPKKVGHIRQITKANGDRGGTVHTSEVGLNIALVDCTGCYLERFRVTRLRRRMHGCMAKIIASTCIGAELMQDLRTNRVR